jgi:protein-disulfide isomerase
MPPCGMNSGCAGVSLTAQGEIHGVPISLFGLVAYLLLWCQLSAFTMCGCLLIAATSLRQSTYSQPTNAPKARTGPLRSVLIPSILPCIAGVAAVVVTLASESVISEIPHDEEALAAVSIEELAPYGSYLLGSQHSWQKVILFSDLNCPACSSLFPLLLDLVARRSDVALVYRHFLFEIDDLSLEAAQALQEAMENGHGLQYIERVLEAKADQGIVLRVQPENTLVRGDVSENEEARLKIRRDRALAKKLGLTGVPMIIFLEGDRDPKLVSLIELKSLL